QVQGAACHPSLSMKSRLLFVLLLALVARPALHAEDTKPAPRPQFIYILRLVERLHDDKAWTKADEETIGVHFRHLKAATERGQAIAVGRTTETGAKTFGLVIFEADNADAARAFAESDPAVLGGIMNVEVRPFALVLQRKP
ncbi:MAG: YciI family protein, partial [Oleiharenicola lentus]